MKKDSQKTEKSILRGVNYLASEAKRHDLHEIARALMICAKDICLALTGEDQGLAEKSGVQAVPDSELFDVIHALVKLTLKQEGAPFQFGAKKGTFKEAVDRQELKRKIIVEMDNLKSERTRRGNHAA